MEFKTGTITATAGLRVRSGPGLTNPQIGVVPYAQRVFIIGTDPTAKWFRVALWNDPAVDPTTSGWVSAEWVRVDSIPPVPIPSKTPLVGLNVLNRHEEVALPAARAGCRYFSVLNNPGFASRLKREYPDATVLARIYWDRRIPSVDEYVQRMDGCRDAGLIYLGLNEADECGQDHDGIKRRAEFDVAVATRIKSISGATYAAGGFSMGTPDYTQQSICDLMREVYAPHWNSGLLSWNHHLYTPNLAYGAAPRDVISTLPPTIVRHSIGKSGQTATWSADWSPTWRGAPATAWIDPQWFETRYVFNFTRCGFNPASPSRVYCDETGLDEGGIGGFPAHGCTPADVVKWAKWWRALHAAALSPSPFTGGAIFQVGNREDWAGYSVEYAYAALAEEVWK